MEILFDGPDRLAAGGGVVRVVEGSLVVVGSLLIVTVVDVQFMVEASMPH